MKPLDRSEDAPWKRRFRAWIAVSADVAECNWQRGLAFSNRTGVAQLHAWDTVSGELRQLTFRPNGKPMGVLDPLGRYVYYHQDAAGDEIGHIVRVPWEGGEPEDITPAVGPYALSMPAFSLDGSRIAFTSATRDGFRVNTAPVSADGVIGEWREIYHTMALQQGIALSSDGTVLVASTTEKSQSTDSGLLAFDAATGAQVGEWHEARASIKPIMFSRSAGDERLLASSTVSGFDRPAIWNPRTGERTHLPIPGLEGDVTAIDWTADGRELLLLQVLRAVARLSVFDIATGRLRELDHPSGSITAAVFAPSGEIWANIASTLAPGRTLALDAETGALKRVLLEGEAAPGGYPWRSFTFESTHGAVIQGWLSTPPGDGPFATILETHGGPTGVATESFHRQAHAWVDHGFAFATINYRGSTTFGYAFQKAINGHLGDFEVDDMVAARDWLVANGVADPARILLTGWSYGGYLTLQALGRRPELWAGGMAGIAIADWRLMYEDQNERLRRYQQALFGGSPEQLPEAHAAASPITYAEHVRAPVLVIQGSNDTRCPARQMRVYEERMLELGKRIEVDWFEAGHGAYAIELQVAHQQRMLEFAYEILAELK